MTSTAQEARVHTIVRSPIGPLRLVGTHTALSGLYMESHRHLPGQAAFGPRDDGPFGEVAAQLEAYFAGDRTDFDVAVDVEGTAFQRAVWEALCALPYGETCSYGELAARIGAPGAARAVGLAVGRNPVSVIVPCHRVVGADGRLTGYGGGLARKRFLLDLEQRPPGPGPDGS